MNTSHRETDTTDRILYLVSPLTADNTPDYVKKETVSLMQRFKDWVARHIVQDIPEELAVCEYCRETRCTEEVRRSCEQRVLGQTFTRNK